MSDIKITDCETLSEEVSTKEGCLQQIEQNACNSNIKIANMRAATPYLCALYVATAGHQGNLLGSDEQEIVLLIYVVIDMTTNTVSTIRNYCTIIYLKITTTIDATWWELKGAFSPQNLILYSKTLFIILLDSMLKI